VSAKMIIRVHPDDRVDVRVEGLTEQDRAKPPGKKLCERVTRRLEQDLGLVSRREYDGTGQEQSVEIERDEGLTLDS
jgi:hypothetical protein